MGNAEGRQQTDCALLGHGEYGWEIVLLRNGAWFYGHRWITRGLAMADADEHLRELERDGWRGCSVDPT